VALRRVFSEYSLDAVYLEQRAPVAVYELTSRHCSSESRGNNDLTPLSESASLATVGLMAAPGIATNV
jgi:hypothetical protein